METIGLCRIPIWRTFGRIQWHVIPEPRITLQDAATWWIHCHDFRATRHIAGCSHLTKSMSWSCHIAGCKDSIRHIENRFFAIFFLFLMQFRFWRAAAFVSSPIDLFWHTDTEVNFQQNWNCRSTSPDGCFYPTLWNICHSVNNHSSSSSTMFDVPCCFYGIEVWSVGRP